MKKLLDKLTAHYINLLIKKKYYFEEGESDFEEFLDYNIPKNIVENIDKKIYV